MPCPPREKDIIIVQPNPNPKLPQRRSIRLRHWDYASPGAYFVTVCTYEHKSLLGRVADVDVLLNAFGLAVRHCLCRIPDHFPQATIDEFVVMPNHVHTIVMLNELGHNASGQGAGSSTHTCAPTATGFGKPIPESLATIVRSVKSAATRKINALRGTPGGKVWQRGYYDRVIRDEDELDNIRRYMADNPRRWEHDRENLQQLLSRMRKNR